MSERIIPNQTLPEMIELPAGPLIFGGQEVEIDDNIRHALLAKTQRVQRVLADILQASCFAPILQSALARFPNYNIGIRPMLLSRGEPIELLYGKDQYRAISVAEASYTTATGYVNKPLKITPVNRESPEFPVRMRDFVIQTGVQIYQMLEGKQRTVVFLAVVVYDLDQFRSMDSSGKVFTVRRNAEKPAVLAVYPIRDDIYPQSPNGKVEA